MSVLNYIDFYKVDHLRQYPKDTAYIFSNMTARSSRIEGVNSVVFFGLQYFIEKYLVEGFKTFFNTPLDKVLNDYRELLESTLGSCPPLDHIEYLHSLRYVPLEIKAVKEGTSVPIGVPFLTINNTDPKCFWLVNYIETMLSATIWKPITTATIAREYKNNFLEYADKTGSDLAFTEFQGHDFSFRGMSGVEDAGVSGMGHLLFFLGTDSVPAITTANKYYPTNSKPYLVGTSIPATEHSVMCMGGEEGELNTYRRLITEVYPSGMVSIVSDTWNLWRVVDEYLPVLKEEILARDGKVVIRPDSGDPVAITLEIVEKLWGIFGGTINDKGFKVLNSHIGVIYGDSITIERQRKILQGLLEAGFASSNVVLGIGSYTYQYITRDTFGMAIKATYGETTSGVGHNIFKDPITDSGTKKSAKGLLAVDSDFNLLQECSWGDVHSNFNMLKPVFEDGIHTRKESLQTIRGRG